MKKLFTLFLLISTCSFAQDIKRYFKVKDFERLDMGSAFIISVAQGSTYSVEVRGREQDVKEIICRVNGNTLDLNYPSSWGNSSKNRKEVYVNITMPKLTAAEFSGASKSTVSGFSSDKLSISISGASVGNFKVNAKALSIDCSGASSLTLIGSGQNIDADVSGASNVNSLDYKVATANIDASGASDIKLFVTSKIVADASGASSVRYKGGAAIKSSTSGAGSVKTMN
ncbi:head GIN domain-containing protein [Emticicia sediminis]